jgi:pre-rRNA-processing protein TSR3
MSSSGGDKMVPKLFCLRFKGKDMGCSPKKCTAMKLNKLGLLKLIPKITGKLNEAILLNPFAQNELSINDKQIALRHGIVVIDCSWNKIFKFRGFNALNSRKLPPLIAANPTNYGKWEKLSSAEALVAALLITGFNEYAELLLSKFSWGNQFKELNQI